MFAKGGPTLYELARQAWSSTDRGYDLLAPKFDKTPFKTPDELLAPAIAAIGDVDVGLDLCCGTGAATAFLRARCRRLTVGVDRSAGMLAQAQRRLSTSPGAPYALLQGDALSLPLRARCDVVVSFGAFGHVLPRDEPRFLASIRDALTDDGRFVFVSALPPPILSRSFWLAHGFNAAMRVRNAVRRPPFIMYYLTFLLPAIARQLDDAGFRVEVREGVFPAPYADLRLVVATKVGAARAAGRS